MKKKTIALLMVAVTLFGVTVGGTIAWLQAETTKVENTFTFGDINIVLDETDTDNDTDKSDITTTGRDKANKYDLIPGESAIKDPKVTVTSGSEKCYVFVKVVEDNNKITTTVDGEEVTIIDQIINYDVDTTNWLLAYTDQATNAKIYVYTDGANSAKEVDASSEDIQTKSVLSAQYGEMVNDKYVDTILVDTELTETMIEQIGENTPVLTFDACAVQSENNTYETALGLARELLATVE